MTGGEGADAVINATGFPGSFSLAASMVRDAGTIVEAGAFVDMGPEAFNPAVICGRSLTVMGTGGEDLQAYDRTLALLARHTGAIPFAEVMALTTRSASPMPSSPSRPRSMPTPPPRSSSRTRSTPA